MSPEQERIAKEMIRNMEKEHIYKNPIVTAVEPFKNFFEAEDYHKNYYKNNSREPYCQIVISPKLKKLRKNHPESIRL